MQFYSVLIRIISISPIFGTNIEQLHELKLISFLFWLTGRIESLRFVGSSTSLLLFPISLTIEGLSTRPHAVKCEFESKSFLIPSHSKSVFSYYRQRYYSIRSNNVTNDLWKQLQMHLVYFSFFFKKKKKEILKISNESICWACVKKINDRFTHKCLRAYCFLFRSNTKE